jgi:hypothetical protein
MNNAFPGRTSFAAGAGALAALTLLSGPASAGSCSGSPPNATCQMGLVTVYADPSDGVILTDTVGPCGSAFYNFQRTQQNFKEIMAVMLTSFSSSKNVWVIINQCSGQRNIIDRGAVTP